MHSHRFKFPHVLMAMLWSLLGAACSAAELTIGDPAPAFALQGSDGKTHRLADYRGQTVVLAWFPKAFTGG
jgi:thioredoxin-dependent peroxiredoxin